MLLRIVALALALVMVLSIEVAAKECSSVREAQFWEADEPGAATRFDPDIIQPGRAPGAFRNTLTKRCGRSYPLTAVLDTGVVRVPMGDGGSIDFIPIFLQRKTQWSCVQIKPRIACVTESVATQDGGRLLTLQSEIGAPERIMPPASIKISPNGRIETIDDYFAVIPLTMKAGGRVNDVRDRVKSKMRGVKCTGDCASMQGWAADRQMVEILRYVRFRQLPRAEVAKDVGLFLDGVGQLSSDAQALQAMIGANEISLDLATKSALLSPFEVADAVDADSGPSFGAHQIDVATNSCRPGKCERQPFRDALARLKQREDAPPGLVSAHESAISNQKYLFEKPIRSFTPEELGLFHRTVPLITDELRGDKGRSEYLKLYASYLKTDTGCMAKLRSIGKPFAGHLGAQLYAVDVKNQFGSSDWLVRVALASWQSRPSEEQTFIDMLRYVREKTKQGRDHPTDVKRRQTNLLRVMPNLSGSTSGGVPSDCDAAFINN